MKNPKFQIFEKFSITNKSCDEDRLVTGIKSSKMQELVMPIRDLVRTGQKEQADNKKKLLPAIATSGAFSGGRKAEHLVEYSHLICLDLDKVPEDVLLDYKNLAIAIPYTRMAFISPSGLGLKILVKVSSGSNYHKDAYRQVMRYYSEKMQVKFDQSTCDVTRLTFMSYDPDAYYFPDSDIFLVDTPISRNLNTEGSVGEKSIDIFSHAEIYNRAYELTLKKFSHVEGQRNNFIFQIVNYANRFGLPQLALEAFLSWSDLPEKDDVLNNVYKNTEQYGTWKLAREADVDLVSNEEIKNDDTATANLFSPTLPEEVYDLLPNFLKGITSKFSSGIDQDMVLLSSIGALSTIFPNVKGIYANASIALNLFQLFVAPPSSGKGQMKWAEAMVKDVDIYLQEKYKKEYADYILSGPDPELEEPVAKKLFIGSDSSNIALSNQMRDNKNIGLIFDSEGGTLGQMFKNDWSNPLNILLKSFENESFSVNRKNKAESFTIEKCILSLVMSTTPSQVSAIVGSIESGLYSRFMIYNFESEMIWKNQFSIDGNSLEPFFKEAAEKVLNFFKASEEAAQTSILLSQAQMDEVNDFFSNQQKEFHKEFEHVLIANVRRTCVMYYKIAMLLTTIRVYEQMSTLPEKMTIAEDDHRAALLIVKTLLYHVKIVYANNPAASKKINMFNGKKQLLLESLTGPEFGKGNFLTVSKDLGIKKPTAEKWLTDYQKEGVVKKLEHGLYSKAA